MTINYYDNIMNVSLYRGAQKLFSTDFKKQLFSSKIPQQFLEHAVLSNMEFTGVDASGFHFVATICIPDDLAHSLRVNAGAFLGTPEEQEDKRTSKRQYRRCHKGQFVVFMK